jgi:hypothetical protein
MRIMAAKRVNPQANSKMAKSFIQVNHNHLIESDRKYGLLVQSMSGNQR